MKTLVLWEGNPLHTPKDPEERFKLWLRMLNGVKKDVDSGRTEMWGIDISANRGFSITSVSEEEVFKSAAAYAPYVTFKVSKCISVDEAIESVKELAKQMASK
jgi:hypothetical protein